MTRVSDEIATSCEDATSRDDHTQQPNYVWLRPGDGLPDLGEAIPLKVVLVIEANVTPDWQHQVSSWMVAEGCRYMMAWGHDSSSWDDSVDFASIDYGLNQTSELVMTTWHDGELLRDVFWFSQHLAVHPTFDLEGTCVIHIAEANNKAELLALFRKSQTGDE